MVISSDNTPRESKNQWFATFNGYLVANEKFEDDDVQYQKPGHTHDDLVQVLLVFKGPPHWKTNMSLQNT